ncbi:MAG: dihydrofolate reductase [Bryobacterales bacterium]|nr:dihydrofolate reductase [Bryobacterales bacterium]
MRKLSYYAATTADGYIAGPNGSLDCFLPGGEHLTDLVRRYPETIPSHLWEALGVRQTGTKFDTVLMGRRTCEPAWKAGIASPYQHLRQYVFSRSVTVSPDSGIELVASDPVAKVRMLKEEQGLGIWLCGGGELATALAGEIDELILKINPTLAGGGTRLFAGEVQPAALKLVEQVTYLNGVLLVHYRVDRD